MSYLASITKQRQTWGRRALGLFAAVWLNLAIQPCAMALDVDDHDCPHCPPAVSHEHGDMHGGMDHDMPCADGPSDCTIDEDWNHDLRGGKSKLKDAPADSLDAIAPHGLNFVTPQCVDSPPGSRLTPAQAGASPPLHVLYCVYLK